MLSELERARFLLYQEKVRSITEKNFKKFFIENKHLRSSEYHLDHKVSVKQCFLENVPPEIAGDIVNLEIVSKEYNLSKGDKSSITVAELLEDYMDSQSYYD